MMRHRWIDPNQPPKPRGPIPTPRARGRRRVIGRALRQPRPADASMPLAPEASESADVPLSEWHDLSPAERQREWRELVAWVEWLHDRYELSIAGRLPGCWPHHPGLIEELRALKTWREQIYTSASPSGQAARAWHNELRSLAASLSGFYATGCRARTDHRAPQALQAANPDATQQWLNADPNAGIPAHLLAPGWTTDAATEGDHMIGHDQMQQQLNDGTATALEGAGEYVHHGACWWAATPDGWLKITDPAVAAELDSAQARLADLAEAAEFQKRLSGH